MNNQVKWQWLGKCIVAMALLAIATQIDAAKKVYTPIPVTTKTHLQTFHPSAAEVLMPPANFGKGIRVAKTAPVIDAGILPGQTKPARLWSNWGDSAFAKGKFYASIGNHGAPYGKALVYEIDPKTKTMKQVVNVDQVGHYTDKTKYSPGKIHSPLIDGGDGWLYFFTFRGSASKTTAELGYVGDSLYRFNPLTYKTQDLGPAIPYNSVAAAEIHIPTHMLYALGDYGQSAPVKRDLFHAYNLKTHKLVFSGGPDVLMARSMIVTSDGTVYYNVAKPGATRASTSKKDEKESAGPVFAKYNPQTNKVTVTDIEVPGDGILRAASRVNAQGVVYGFSKDGVIFSFNTKTEKVKEITKTTFAGSGYTAVCRLSPSGRYLYYVPNAHGRSSKGDTPIFQLDTQTGKRKVLAFLNKYFRKQWGYNLGGTFGIALNADASQLFICWNGRPIGGKNDDFGQCSVMIIHIPKSERGIN